MATNRPRGNNQVRDIGPLANLTELTSLRLDGNQISDISPLANLTKLIGLELEDNQVRDISPLPLDRMDALRSLILSDNQIRDISPLTRAPQTLTHLWLAYNQIRDISPITGLTALESLHLHSNEIRDISPITGLTALETLWLNWNPLSYASIYTHIPPLRAKGISQFGVTNRILESLVLISGDEQTGMSGVQLASPFVVETRDGERELFAGVPLTFTLTEGGGTLNPLPSETDDDGIAESTLTPETTLGRHTVEVTVIHEGTTLRTTFTADVLPSALTVPTFGDALPTTL